MGYILLGLGISFYSGNSAGAQGSLFHLFNHGLMKGLAFLSAGALLYTLHIRAGDHEPLVIGDLAGAARRYPLIAMGLSIAVLALGGLPPLAGFMSKWQIFVAGFQTGNLWIEVAVIFAALNSVLSLAYYAPLVNSMYRLEPSARVRKGRHLPAVMSLPVIILAAAVVVIGIWPGLMNWLTIPAGQAVLAGLVH
jgi:formate hydrogenlyase subunit 3/multisubunit Na+/H+ antiporter MnhD subunit